MLSWLFKSKPQYLSPEQIADTMISRMSDTDKQSWIMPHNDLIMGHHGVGRQIRNEFKLWEKGNPYTDASDPMGSKHPDQVSMTVMGIIWAKLNVKDVD